MDGSGSFRGSRNIALSEIETFGTTLSATNQAEVLLFGLEVIPFGPFNAMQGLTDALPDMRGARYSGSTRLFNTLAKAIKHASASPLQNKRVVLFTDGGEESAAFTSADADNLIRDAQLANVKVWLIASPSRRPSRDEITWLDLLERIQRETGGELLELSPGNLGTLSQPASKHYDLVVELCGLQGNTPPQTFLLKKGTDLASPPFTFRGTLPASMMKPCPKLCDPATCQSWESCTSAEGTCQAIACSSDAQCTAASTHCKDGQCAPGTPFKLTGAHYLAIVAGLLVLLAFIAWLIRRSKEEARRREETLKAGEAKQAALQEELSNKQQEAEEARRQLALAKSESAEQSKPAPISGQAASALAELPEAHLVVTHGPKRLIGTKYRLVRQRNRVGAASDNDVEISVPAVSGTHMEIQIFPSGDIFVQDLNSTNGTFIDSVKMAPGARTKISEGAQLSLGQNVKLELTAAADSTKSDANDDDSTSPPSSPSAPAEHSEKKSSSKKRTIYDPGS